MLLLTVIEKNDPVSTSKSSLNEVNDLFRLNALRPLLC